jgi:hypothetical protein
MRYFEWRTLRSQCECGWSGINEESDFGIESFDELFEYFCPSCSSKLGIQLYPTTDETESAAHSGDPEAIRLLRDVD